MPITAVVFDLFDTLVDLYMEKIPNGSFRGRPVPASAVALHAAVQECTEIPYEQFAQALIDVDAEFFASRYAEGLELPTRERFAALAKRLGLYDSDLPGELTAIHMATLREQVWTPEHHSGVLCQLRERAKIAVCSNFSDSSTALLVLEESGLRAHLDVVVVSETIGIRKPRGEIFDAVREGLSVVADEVLHVGDNLEADIDGAAAAGFRTAWLTRRINDPEAALARHSGARPDARIEDLAELPGLIDSIGVGPEGR
jgi:FMN phosphatase YigB (HAD superfamily)